jgi:hypothetical protein
MCTVQIEDGSSYTRTVRSMLLEDMWLKICSNKLPKWKLCWTAFYKFCTSITVLLKHNVDVSTEKKKSHFLQLSEPEDQRRNGNKASSALNLCYSESESIVSLPITETREKLFVSYITLFSFMNRIPISLPTLLTKSSDILQNII